MNILWALKYSLPWEYLQKTININKVFKTIPGPWDKFTKGQQIFYGASKLFHRPLKIFTKALLIFIRLPKYS